MDRSIKRNAFAYILILPTALYLLVFQLYPLVESLRLSLTDYNLLMPETNFVGLKNYIFLLTQDERFWPIVINSFKWIGISLVFQLGIGLAAALILNRKFAGRGLWRGLTMVPWVIPVVVVGIMLKWMGDYNYGLINYYLKELHIISEYVNWFGDRSWVWPSLIMSAAWKGFAYPAVMFLAGLQGIPSEMYEAAFVDGANAFKKFWHITLPMLKPVLIVTGVVQIITGWTKFEMIWVLTNGGPGFATSILPTYIYTNSFDFCSA